MPNLEVDTTADKVYTDEAEFFKDMSELHSRDSVFLVKTFVVYDAESHMITFDDNEVISKGKECFFDGLVVDDMQGRCYQVHRFGPISCWWDYDLDRKKYHGLTSRFQYVLHYPSDKYNPVYKDAQCRLQLLRLTLEYHEAGRSDNLGKFMEHLQAQNKDLSQPFLLKHSNYLMKRLELHEDNSILNSKVMRALKMPKQKRRRRPGRRPQATKSSGAGQLNSSSSSVVEEDCSTSSSSLVSVATQLAAATT